MTTIPRSLYTRELSYISTLAERYVAALSCLQEISSQIPEIIQYVKDTPGCDASALYNRYGIDGETFCSDILLSYSSPIRWSVREYIEDALGDYKLSSDQQEFFNSVQQRLTALLP